MVRNKWRKRRPKKPRRVNYEAVLRREGLEPLDRDGCMLSSRVDHERATNRDAASLWLEWAQGVVRTFPFRTAQQEHVWEMLSEGYSITDTAGFLGISRGSVKYALQSVAALVSPPPVSNPWRRNAATTVQQASAETLAEAVARDPVTAATMLNEATTYISELGDDCMKEYRERIGVDDVEDLFGHGADWDQYAPRVNGKTPRTEHVMLPSDNVPAEELSGACRTLSRAEIAKLNYTPPRQIRKVEIR